MTASKFFRAVVILIVAVFIINQLVSSLYMPIKTENAVFYTATDGTKITGHIIRGETLVTNNKEGVLHFLISDGVRVGKNGTIANIYNDAEASITVSQMDVLKSQIADIEDILGYNDIEAANLDLLNSKIKSALSDFIVNTSAGNYGETDELTEALLSASNRKQVALGEVSGLSERLSSLKKELKELSSSLPSAKGKIKAEESGYFVSKTDGYETVLTTDDLDKITPEYLKQAQPQPAASNCIGKIVSDYEWYIAATVDFDESLNYKEGQALKLLTSIKSSPTLSVTVKKINALEGAQTAVVIFACSDMNSELATIRTGTMTVVNKEYSGLRISPKALRVVDKVRGVYVQNGMQVNFVPVEIVYRNEAYIICEKQNENGNILKLYDKVVVKGRNLYDGKIVG